MAEEHRLRRRAAPRPQRQAAQAPPPRPLLAGPHNLDIRPERYAPARVGPAPRRFGLVAAHAPALIPPPTSPSPFTGASVPLPPTLRRSSAPPTFPSPFTGASAAWPPTPRP